MRTALITGGSGGIGSAICKGLARQDIHVIVHGNNNFDKATDVTEQIIDQGGSAEAIVFDVTDHEACAAKLETLIKQQPIQIIVNNAGIHIDAPLAGMNVHDWRKVIDVTVHGFYNVTQPLLMAMIATRWGRIINMSSISGVMGNRGQCNYAAAKAALHGATKSLALELASRKITVNTIAPGIIQGQHSESTFSADRIKSIVPMKRAGTPDEVAALTAFLCSDDAGYISGQIIGINGAMI